MRTERMTYLSADGETELEGYLAAPDGPGPYPTVLILRGVAGPEDGYTEIANRAAGLGYLAFLHGWKIRGDDPPDDPVKLDLAGAVTYLGLRRDVDTSRLAVFGFCRGGVHALIAAVEHSKIRVAAVFHGFAFRPDQAQPGLQPFDLVSEISVPTLIQHGTEDEQATIESMRRLESHARALASPIQFKYYDGVRHGFAVRTHPGFDARTAEESLEQAFSFVSSAMV